jgi:hypothetical protein
MSLVCFGSFKGSPGTTLTALATAAAWPTGPNRRKLLLEADADGGVLGTRYQLPTKPGLISLAAAARRGLAPERIWDHAQILPGGLPVVLGPDGPQQASDVLRGSGRDLGRWLAGLGDVDVIADLGRLSVGSAALELALTADCVLAVVRPVAEQLVPASQRMVALAKQGLQVGWILIGDRPYSAHDVQIAFGLPVIHVVEYDPRGAGQFEAGTSPEKLRRSLLVRSVAGLADHLASTIANRQPPQPTTAVSPPPPAAPGGVAAPPSPATPAAPGGVTPPPPAGGVAAPPPAPVPAAASVQGPSAPAVRVEVSPIASAQPGQEAPDLSPALLAARQRQALQEAAQANRAAGQHDSTGGGR